MDKKEKSIRNAGWMSLGDTESIEKWSHPTIYPYLPGMLVGFITALVGILIPFFIELSLTLSAVVILGSLIFGFIIFLIEYLKYITVFYVFTDSRLVKKVGILDHSVTDVAYDNIEDNRQELPIEGRILGFGHMYITNASPETDDIELRFIPQIKSAAEVIGNYRAMVTDRRTGESDQ